MSAASVMGFEDILACSDIQYEEVTAWGKKIALMSITAGEVLDWVSAKESGDEEVKKGAALLLTARCMVTAKIEGGPPPKRLCDTPEKEQAMVAALKLKDSKNVQLVVSRALRMNGIVDDEVTGKKAETIDVAKNA